MSKKYILEVEDEPYEIEEGIGYFRCTEAKWWMISECTLNRLPLYCTELAQHEYQRGLSDAWDVARKLILSKDEGGLSYKEIEKIFGHNCIFSEIIRNEPLDVIDKLKAYDEQKSWNKGMVEVGDEIIVDCIDDIPCVVTAINTDRDGSIVSVLYQDGTNASFRPNEDDFRKTGRNHFSEVSKLIDALREDDKK